ncbi:hypothetical protein Sjap_025481 [Stephania japonica]|uniref:Uncharacterized protein n=1 Tax=Stephania japonica TaxID=461633 RepID=A0AAP0E4D5_9MAGN
MESTSKHIPQFQNNHIYTNVIQKEINEILHLGTSSPTAHKKSPRQGPLPLLLSVLSPPTVTN